MLCRDLLVSFSNHLNCEYGLGFGSFNMRVIFLYTTRSSDTNVQSLTCRVNGRKVGQRLKGYIRENFVPKKGTMRRA